MIQLNLTLAYLGEVNGVPGHANSKYINDILKGELNFTGFTVSDWEDIERLYTRDKVAATPREAVRLAVMAGVDMSMVPFRYTFFNECIVLAEEDKAFAARIDDAVRRILMVKEKLGLFDSVYPVKDDLKKFDSDESYEFNLEAARETVILVKNEDNILPLDRNKKILVTGPTADLLQVLNGAWSYSW
jgi:beta-glucosidase